MPTTRASAVITVVVHSDHEHVTALTTPAAAPTPAESLAKAGGDVTAVGSDGSSLVLPQGWLQLPHDAAAREAALGGLPGGRPPWADAVSRQVQAAAGVGGTISAVEASSGRAVLSLVRKAGAASTLGDLVAQARVDLAAAGAAFVDERRVDLAAGPAHRLAAALPSEGAMGRAEPLQLVQYAFAHSDTTFVLSISNLGAALDPVMVDGIAASLRLA